MTARPPEAEVNAEASADLAATPAGAAAYRRVLGADGFATFAASSLIGRLIGAMAPLAIVLYVHHAVGSFGAAGVATAAFAIGLGLTAPVLARLVDTRGRGGLVPMALVCALALAALVALGNAGAAPWLLVVAAAVAGAASPPLNGVTRHHLSELVEPADLPTAYAVDSILLELIFISGPLLAGGLAATVGPGEGLILAGAIALIGTSLFALELPPHRRDPAAGPRSRLGALTSPAIRLLAVGGLPIGATLGALDVALPAFGVTHGSAALGAVFAAAFSVGSGLGGVAYGTRPRALGHPRRTLMRLTAIQAVLVLPLLLGPPVPEMLVLAALAGLCLAPLLSVRSELVRELLPPGTGAEAFTWTTLTIAVGAGVGSALAGPLVEAGGWRAGVALAAAAPAVGLLWTLARRHVL